MSDDSSLSLDVRLKQAVRALGQALEERGALREPARALAQKHSERIYLSSNGAFRIVGPGGVFFPANDENPFEQLVSELVRSLPATEKIGTIHEDQAAAAARLKRSGMY